jgi:ATP-dependent helicase HepA
MNAPETMGGLDAVLEEVEEVEERLTELALLPREARVAYAWRRGGQWRSGRRRPSW